MKMLSLFALACMLPAFAAAAEPVKMTEDQKTLYFFGNKVMARNLNQFNFTPEEAKYIIMGMNDAMKNAPAKVDDSYGPKLNEYIGKKQAAIMEKEKARATVEKGKSRAFLDEMAQQKGAQKLAGGVVYIPMKEGAGASPKAADRVKVHYHGTFTDGKIFDSSVDRGVPAEFPLNQVIPCWTEGVQKIQVGGKAKLVCPSGAAYGDEGRPGAIPGGATLVFEVELLDIVTKPEAKAEMTPAVKEAEKK